MKSILYPVLLILLIASCRPAKKVQRIEHAISKKDTSHAVLVKPEEPVDSFSLVKNIISDINANRISFKTFSAKVKLDYQGKDESDQATAFIRMQKDSLIWISLTGAFGIEGFRVLINKDSVLLMNKLNKFVQVKSINSLQETIHLPLDFYSLQDIIIGNPVFIDSNIVSYKSNGNELLVLMIGNLFKNLVTVDTKDFKVTHCKLDDINPLLNRTANLAYSNYASVNNFLFSTVRKISVSEKSKLDIDLVFKQYSFDQPQTFPFNIPKNYKWK